jgi:hypothetical protein
MLVILAGGALRAQFVDHAMRYDEAMLCMKYVQLPAAEIISRYDRLQNHVLHTLTVHSAVRAFGDAPAVVRLPTFVAGTLLIPLAMVVAMRLCGSVAAAIAAGALVATNGLLVDYATNARGYTFVAVATLVMCAETVALLRGDCGGGWRCWAAWVIAGAFGAWSIPIMVFPAAGLAVLLAVDVLRRPAGTRRRRLGALFVAVAGCAALTVLLYAPALVRTPGRQLDALPGIFIWFSREHVGGLGRMTAATWDQWTAHGSTLACLLGSAGVCVGTVVAARRRDWAWAVPVALAVVGLGIALLLPVSPYPRVWLYLLPVVLVYGACGLTMLFHARRGQWIVAGVLTVAAVLGGWRVHRAEHLLAEDPRTLVDAEAIAWALQDEAPETFALITAPATYAVRYYGRRYGLPRPGHPAEEAVERVYVAVVDGQTVEEVMGPHAAVLEPFDAPVRVAVFPHSRLYVCPRRAG